MVGHAELAHSAELSQPAAFSPPLLNAPDQLGKKNPCQPPLQAQSQSQLQSQIPVQQPPDSQRASSGSVGSSLTQQKQLGTLTGTAGQAPTEVITEVWTHGIFTSTTQVPVLLPLKGRVSDVMYFVSSLIMFAFCRSKPRRNILEGRAMRGTSQCRLCI